mgnify:CR=1 FL=1
MREVTIELNTIDKVKSFCNEAWKIDGDLDIVSGRHNVDGKSIMGILSLDLSRPLTLQIKEDDVDITSISPYFVSTIKNIVKEN